MKAGITQIIDLADELASNTEWRVGQCLFNACYALLPDVANEIRATKHDCFYNDENIVKFLKKVGDIIE